MPVVHKLSEYLVDKHWDFILCYSAATTQRLSKLNAQHAIKEVGFQIFSINFFDLIHLLIKCMHFRVRDNMTHSYSKTIYSDWSVFFSKEIFDPILVLYVKTCENYSLDVDSVMLCAIKKLSIVASVIPMERLIFNELEPKFNVLDLDLELSGASLDVKKPQRKVINLSDSLKTVINHLYPNLKHKISFIQLSSFKILKTIMQNISKYYQNDVNEEQTDASYMISIIESLPYVIRETFIELTHLFSDLKYILNFDENILITKTDSYELDANEHHSDDEDNFLCNSKRDAKILNSKEMQHDANNRIMSFMLVNRLMLELFATEDLEFKVKLVNELREKDFNDYLMNLLFRLMPTYKNASMKLFSSISSQNINEEEENMFEFDSLINCDNFKKENNREKLFNENIDRNEILSNKQINIKIEKK